MTPIGQIPIGEAISSIRDIVVVIGVLTFGWKIRGWVQPGIDFFKMATLFMVDMRRDMHTLLNNHLLHIESDLRHMSGRKPERKPEHIDYILDSTEGDDVVR